MRGHRQLTITERLLAPVSTSEIEKTVAMMDTSSLQNQTLQALSRLLNILEDLRSKCPWDRQQTMASLRPLTIEETFELSEALVANNMEHIKEELGDLLLHIFFYGRIATEQNAFTMGECIHALCDKLVLRHPHIYQQVLKEATTSTEDVNKNWQKIKLIEKNRASILEGIPSAMPSLSKAMCIHDKASSVGFLRGDKEEAWSKVQEELQELVEAVGHVKTSEVDHQQEHIEDELGDVFASLIIYARCINVDPDKALERANLKFIKRFQCIERQLREDRKEISELSIEEMAMYWKRAKEQLEALKQEPIK
eukprot:gene173-231_t